MSKDLISRKALVAALVKEREQYPPMVAERYSFGVKLPHQFNQAMRGGIRKALRLVETAVAIDAEPVRHGRWERMDEYCNHSKTFRCSACKSDVEYSYFTRFCEYDYCPNCGARMDLEVQDGA